MAGILEGMKFSSLSTVALVLLAVCGVQAQTWAQTGAGLQRGLYKVEVESAQPAQENPAGQARATSTPYAGDLSIFEYPDRDKKLQIDRVMDLLGIQAGKSVADIGAGSGWFTVRAARRVGPGGMVYAEEINPKAIEYINDRAQK